MSNIRLKKIPAFLLSILGVAVLALGLGTGCSESKKDEVNVIGKVVLTIPISSGEDGEDETTVAPETVERYQVSAFREDGICVYSDNFVCDNENTKGNVTSLSINKHKDEDNNIVGITYGTKDILITYLDKDNIFLGYTLLHNLELRRPGNIELVVNRVFLADVVKEKEAFEFKTVANIYSGDYTEDSKIFSKDDEVLPRETYEAKLGDTIQLIPYLGVKIDPINTSRKVTFDVSDTNLAYIGTPTDLNVLTVDKANPNCFTCIGGGSADIESGYSFINTITDKISILVDSPIIIGNVKVQISAEDLATLGDVQFATIAGKEETEIPVNMGTFVLENVVSSKESQTVTFYDSERTVLGTGELPAYEIVELGSVVDVQIVSVVPADKL